MDHWTDLDWTYARLFGTHPDWERVDWFCRVELVGADRKN